MNTPPLLTCERSGTWAAAAQAALARARILAPAVETRSFAECRRCFEQGTAAAGILVVEATAANVGEALDLLTAHVRRRPRTPRFVVGPRLPADYEPLFREAGASAWLTSPRALEPLTSVYRKYAERLTSLPETTDETTSPADRVRTSLPWAPSTHRNEHSA